MKEESTKKESEWALLFGFGFGFSFGSGFWFWLKASA